MTVSDADGVAAILNVNVVNGSTVVPRFTAGTKASIVLTTTKTDPSKRTFWEFDVRDSKGVMTHCV